MKKTGLAVMIGLMIIFSNAYGSDVIDISGKWYSNIDTQYHIMQRGNTFS